MLNEPEEISLNDLKTINLKRLSESRVLHVLESDFPECYISRKGSVLFCEIMEHIYTKFWTHKYHAMVFAEAMVRAVRRFTAESLPLSSPVVENDDEPHIFISWRLSIPTSVASRDIIDAILNTWNSVWQRANNILEGSESVLVLGKDTGTGLQRLKKIAAVLEDLGYYVYLVKEQPDRLGESIIQKVLRYALLSRFVLIENSEASGHLYEVPHITKMAESVTAVLQENGKGATWMFEDAYGKYKTWKKFTYKPRDLAKTVREAALWSQATFKEFCDFQQLVLPWMKK